MRKLLLLLALGACDDDWGWGATITPEPRNDDAWVAAVRQAAQNWTDALPTCTAEMGPAFEVGRNGHPVVLLPVGEDLQGDAAGYYTHDCIRVRAELGGWNDVVITHELGHALGFDHVPDEVDPHSIMNPYAEFGGKISEGDVRRARLALGCP